MDTPRRVEALPQPDTAGNIASHPAPLEYRTAATKANSSNWEDPACSLCCGGMICAPLIPGIFAIMFGWSALRKPLSPAQRAVTILGMILGVGNLILWGNTILRALPSLD